VCLWDWHLTLQANESCSHGDSEFHYGLVRGDVVEKMLSPGQRVEVFAFLRDSMLDRLDQERGFIYAGVRTPAFGWIGRLNSLGLVMPQMERLWSDWWTLSTPGQSVAAIQYISGLMYDSDENPLFGKWTPDEGGGAPFIAGDDSFVSHEGWLPTNLQFIRGALTLDYVRSTLERAVKFLDSEPEAEKALGIQRDFPARVEIVERRLCELPDLLAKPCGEREWSV
jgi:hypothetical protein